jgi:hypothetical protein
VAKVENEDFFHLTKDSITIFWGANKKKTPVARQRFKSLTAIILSIELNFGSIVLIMNRGNEIFRT